MKSFLLIMLGMLFVGSPVFAIDYNSSLSGPALKTQCQTNRSALQTLVHANLSTVKSNRKTFDQTHPDLKTLFKTNITSQQKKTIKQAMQSTRLQMINTMTTFATNYFDTLNTALIATTVSTLKTQKNTLFTTLKPYIDTNKLTQYDTYTADFLRQLETNKTLRLTTYAEILKYMKYCGGGHRVHDKLPGVLNGLFQSDHDRD